MLSEKMQGALNTQVNAEMYSGYLYLSMSAYAESANLPGFAHWMRLQAQEELSHAIKFFDYISDRGGRVVLKAIEAPKVDWASPQAIFEETLQHEKKVTSMINDLVNLAIDERDHATNNMLTWFVTEQVEEEKTADGILQQIKMLRDAPNGLYMIDRELSQRVFTPPADEGVE